MRFVIKENSRKGCFFKVRNTWQPSVQEVKQMSNIKILRTQMVNNLAELKPVKKTIQTSFLNAHARTKNIESADASEHEYIIF